MTNGLAHHYQLGETTVNDRGVRSNVYFFIHFSMKFPLGNILVPDGTPHSAASHLGLCCLHMSRKKDASRI